MIVRHYQGAGISEDDVSQNGHTWVALRQGATASVDVAAIGLGGHVNLVANAQAMSVVQQRVSAGYFRVLAVAPAVGREFTDDEDRPAGPAGGGVGHSLLTQAFHAGSPIRGRIRAP